MSAEFLEKYTGVLRGVMQWDKLDRLWENVLNQKSEGWYIYALGHDFPEKVSSGSEVEHFIARMDNLLHEDHDEDYCGIVYADDFSNPALVKIFDPNNLGTSCGSSSTAVQPGWVLCRDKPVPLGTDVVLPGNRKRWWRRLWN